MARASAPAQHSLFYRHAVRQVAPAAQAKGGPGNTPRPAQAVEKTPAKESLAEFLRPQPQESNQNPSFPATCASEMTLLMVEGVTFSQENEPLPPCGLSRKSGFAAFSTLGSSPTVMSSRGTFPQLKQGASSAAITGSGRSSCPAQKASRPTSCSGVYPLPQGPHIQIVFPLGQPPAVGGAQQGHVTELRRRQAQALIEPELPGGGGEQIPPPHHLGDPHVPVVIHHRQLVGIHPVGAAEDEVPQSWSRFSP